MRTHHSIQTGRDAFRNLSTNSNEMKKRKLLFINAHPDDDTIIAGTMLALRKNGWIISEYVCTDGSQAEPVNGETLKNMVANRIKETELFNQLIGGRVPRIYPTDGKTLVANDEILFDLIKNIRAFRPDVIVVHNRDDYHFEHKRSYELALIAIEGAFRNTLLRLGKRLTDGIILEADGLNVMHNPLIVFDISSVYKEKVGVITKSYGKRLGKSLLAFDDGLSKMRGARIGLKYAEVYDLLNPNWYKLTAKSAKILSEFVAIGLKKK